MAFIFTDGGELIALGYLTGRLATTQPLTLHLFVNNITPAETDNAGMYTEASFDGYAAKSLVGGNWSAGNPSVYAMQQFVRSAPGATQYVFGYFMKRASGGEVILAERPDDAPIPMTNLGDHVDVTPSIGGQ